MANRKTCKRCGKHKTVPAKPQKGVSPKEFLRDPYCSRRCLEIDLGITEVSQHIKTGRKEAA